MQIDSKLQSISERQPDQIEMNIIQRVFFTILFVIMFASFHEAEAKPRDVIISSGEVHDIRGISSRCREGFVYSSSKGKCVRRANR
jgi:hypothetical protein